MLVTIGTMGRAHGLRGEVSVILRTDSPEDRFVRGTQFTNSLANPATLTVVKARVASERWYVQFKEVTDRTGAESLNGGILTLEVDLEDENEADPDAWYPEQLEGLEVVTTSGQRLGTVTGVESYPAQDLLVIDEPGNPEPVLLPLVERLVPEVDIDGGRVVVSPPGGLFAALPAEGAEQ
ncbi:ribosome maturation factor RimM [Micrococcales bacterium 31B]|nr:ribosome maturation factor RimM [Micrococcales bacterium 31B]